MQDNELKAELFNQYNNEAPNKIAYILIIAQILLTVKGVTGDAYLGGGISADGAEWSIASGERMATNEDLDPVDVKVNGDGTYCFSNI